MFSEILEKVYGYPFIEADNMTIMPVDKSQIPHKPYLETSTMIALEILFKRLIDKKSTICKWHKMCLKAQYTSDDKRSKECLFDQWNKTEQCLMTEVLRYYGIKENEYIQEEKNRIE